MIEQMSIVLIDDNPLQLTLLERTLRHLGVVQIQTFNHGSDALAWIAKNKTDIVFCDLQMPEHDGIEVLTLLNQQAYSGHVIILSAMERSITAAVRSMCHAFSFKVIAGISKPYKVALIKQLLLSVTAVEKPAQKPQSVEVSESDVLVALAQGQIVNYYQPLVDFDSEEIIGVEALARWVHPQFGIVSPALFLPIIERCQLFHELFDNVFYHAIAHIRSGLINCHVSLNVDHVNLQNETFADEFLSTCWAHGVSPEQFTIEITERDTYSDSTVMFKNLSRLRINGVSVSIDDFGTGHSSLKKLSALPFNEIKIDRSFVQGLITEPKNCQIIRFVCSLAQALGISVVAEGVENETTWNTLKTYGIDICQGFYSYRPMSVQDLAAIQ
ncbi:EAL domain-containing response regulator [Vibrio hippocampi]|uniref:Sensor histidine kinase RcsC n=1 Tax=Vibrio hippocampi TaxID=654686 RepID=A0ABM8ZNM5_9VIBR|nr:EAL domain-containing response regulator [Vibrio hippocampi]CAH0529979.1 Sensor histidine kinase RcsC [Vibrio hippocampi]